ncbi:spore coat U domain-containing protein [Pseudomonas chlororaphis]|uniref:Csu type fimbrial protein n=1 Tax=Pseudomonas chlororaphis TaxID=587753 RepID=UPI001926A99A|nr:spore coat U domain-containing protein [Pseudomonas chlororaphis]QQX57088.1 spore coat protein U domain-containing protein [Pseudomonas chlororaphis subsp. aurantiaca]
MKPYLALLLLILTLGLSPQVLADCTANMSSVNFGNISPIANVATTASGTITVTCTWDPATLYLNVLVCANLGTGDASLDWAPRSMANGSNLLRYNLYMDSAYSTIWGSTFSTSAATPLSMTLSSSFSLGAASASKTATIYGKVPAGQTTVPTVNNSSTVYTESFSGVHTRLDFQYYIMNPPTCASMTAQTVHFPFVANATVINNCNITTTPLSFGSNSLLNSAVSSTATISVQCTNGDAYEVALDGGTTTGSVGGRQMVGSNSGDKVSYQLYLDSAHATAWGDGTNSTSMAAGTGSGAVQSLTVYGLVPIQPLPTPDTYSDIVKATVYF